MFGVTMDASIPLPAHCISGEVGMAVAGTTLSDDSVLFSSFFRFL